jgi:hypothetical protein
MALNEPVSSDCIGQTKIKGRVVVYSRDFDV